MNPWEARYQAGETGWDRGEAGPMLRRWLADGLLAPCRILVPGCGRGHEVIDLARRGFDVTALDLADTPVRELRAALKREGVSAEVVQTDFFEWRTTEPFDAIYEQTSLCAIQPRERQQYADCLADWLRPEGVLFALIMQTDKPGGPPFHCAMDDMRTLFAQPRWQWPEHKDATVNGPNRRELAWRIERSDATHCNHSEFPADLLP